MKKTILLFVAILIASFGFAQTNTGLNFKGLVTNNGNPVANSIISVKVTLKKGSITQWAETHSNVHTDANGIFSINIGEGTRTGGTAAHFKDVPWGENDIKYTVQVDAGSGYTTLIHNQPLKYVPYAKSAEKLQKQNSGYIEFEDVDNCGLKFNQGNHYYLKGTSSGFGFYYGNTLALRFFGSTGIYVRGYVKTPEIHSEDTGNSNMMPIAYGVVKANGTLRASSGNVTVNKSATGIYQITLTGISTLSSADVVPIATPGYSSNDVYIRAYVQSNKVYVKTRYGGSNANREFNFVIYKK